MHWQLRFKIVFIVYFCFIQYCLGQNLIEHYESAKKDSLQIGIGSKDFLSFIPKGYTLSLPTSSNIKGTLIFLEGSQFDQKNKTAKLIYKEANTRGFAVISVSTEIPLDFYFTNASCIIAHQLISQIFKQCHIPNDNIFLIGIGLAGHRAMRYQVYLQTNSLSFRPDIKGMIICDAPLDWVRQYNEGARDVRMNYNKGSVWEGKLTTYLLEEHLKGTPSSNLDSYLQFSAYSYTDHQSRNIHFFKDVAVRTYAQVAIEYWLDEKLKTPFDNNMSDMVGLIAELRRIGNKNSELRVIYPQDNRSKIKNVFGTWTAVNKVEFMDWIIAQLHTK